MLICKNNTQGNIKIIIDSTHSINLSEGQFVDLIKDFSYKEIAKSRDLAEKIMKGTVIINSGSTDLSKIDAIDLIRGFAEELPTDNEGNIIIREKPFKDDDGFRKRIKGYKTTVNAKGDTEVMFEITEERWMDGIELIMKGHKTGDNIKFITLDTTGIYEGKYYPPGTPLPFALDQFGDEYYVAEDTQRQGRIESNFLARLLPGMAIKMIYTGTAETQVENGVSLYFNLFAYIKTVAPQV